MSCGKEGLELNNNRLRLNHLSITILDSQIRYLENERAIIAANIKCAEKKKIIIGEINNLINLQNLIFAQEREEQITNLVKKLQRMDEITADIQELLDNQIYMSKELNQLIQHHAIEQSKIPDSQVIDVVNIKRKPPTNCKKEMM